MRVKMIIFKKAKDIFDFSFSRSHFQVYFTKMNLKMKPKMNRKWPENANRERP